MYKKRFSSQFNEPFLDFEGERRMAVRWKGFSCHCLSHIRSKEPIYNTDVILELRVHCPIPFFLLGLFPKLLFSYPPTFLTCCWSCPSVVPQMSSPVPAACIFSPTQIAFPKINFKEPLMEVSFRKIPTIHFLASARMGFKCPCSSQRLIQNLVLSR